MLNGNLKYSDYAEHLHKIIIDVCGNNAVPTWSSMLADSIHNSHISTSCFVTAGAQLCSCLENFTMPQHQQQMSLD